MTNNIFKEDGIIKCTSDTVVGYEQLLGGVIYRVTDDSNLQTDMDNSKNLCTTFVTDMKQLFSNSANSTYLSEHDITKWDVSSVTDMLEMFRLSSIDQDIGNWDTGNVTSMQGLFEQTSFNQDIGRWDVSSVTDMQTMFSGPPFNQDISNWDVSNVTDMSYMFFNSSFNQNISNWSVSSVINTEGMFDGSDFNQDIGNWDVSSVTDMYSMFDDTPMDQDLSRWAVPNIGSQPHSFGNSGTNPNWGTTSYPHIKFQPNDSAPIVVHIYTDSGRTTEISESPVTANKHGFTQIYVPNDDTTYYYDGYGILEGDFTVTAGTSSTDMLNTFMTVIPSRYYGTKELKMMAKDGWISINDHNQLPNYVSTEHIDWTVSQTENVHPDNYTDTRKIIQVIDGSGGTDLNTSGIVPFDTEIRKDDIFAHSNTTNPTQITINETGWYRIIHTVTYNNDDGNNDRVTIRSRIRKNGGTFINGSGSRTYMRDFGHGEYNHTGSSIITQLQSGDYIEVYGDHMSGSTGGTYTVADETQMIVEQLSGGTPPNGFSNPANADLDMNGFNITNQGNVGGMFYAYDAGGGVTIPNSWTDIPLDTEVRDDFGYSHSSGSSEITIDNDGWYKVNFEGGAQVSDSGRSHVIWRLVKDDGSGFSEIGGARGLSYHRTSADDASQCSITILHYFSSGDSIKAQGNSDRTSEITTQPNTCRMMIEKK